MVFRNGSVPRYKTERRFRLARLFRRKEGGLCDGQECERVDLLDLGDSVVPQLPAIL
jgi:hypothetical protein